LTALIASIATGLGMSVSASKAAAAEAKATREAVEKQGKRRFRGGVIEGLPPGSDNARSLTRMLSGGLFGRSAVPPPRPETASKSQELGLAPEPAKPYSPATAKGDWRGLARNMWRSAIGYREPAPADSQRPRQEWYSTQQTPRTMTQRATNWWAQKQEQFGSWIATRGNSMGGRLGGWMSRIGEGMGGTGAIPMPTEGPKLSLAAKAGDALVRRGSAMGGRLGGIFGEVGSFFGGSAARVAAAGAAGGGGAAGAVAGAGAAGAGAAGAGVLATAATGIGAVVAAFGAVVLATAGVQKALSALAESFLESNRDLAKFNGTIANALAQSDFQKLGLQYRQASATSGTVRGLADSTMELREAMQPMSEAMGNLKNITGIGMAKVATILAQALSILTPMVNAVNQFCASWMGLNMKDQEKEMPFVSAMHAFVGHAHTQAKNRKIGE
jgi:hypothetical protein